MLDSLRITRVKNLTKNNRDRRSNAISAPQIPILEQVYTDTDTEEHEFHSYTAVRCACDLQKSIVSPKKAYIGQDEWNYTSNCVTGLVVKMPSGALGSLG